MTQGYPLSPTILNMVVDAIIHHWATLVSGEASGLEVFGREVQTLYTLFFADDGLLVSPCPYRIQVSLTVLMGLFKNVGLQKYSGKKVGIKFQP